MGTTQINGGTQVQDATVTNAKLAGSIADAKLLVPYIKADGTRAFTGNQALGGFKFTGTADASADTDVPSWGQVKALSTSRDWKDEVDVATTAAGTLASSFQNGSTVDGVSLVTGWRILIKDQAAPAENGIYTVNATGTPTRATDADSSAEVTAGMQVPVVRGALNVGTIWLMTTTGAITLGTTGLTFVQTGEQLTVDSSLVRTGHQLGRAALTGAVTASAGSNATTLAASVVGLSNLSNLAANSVIGNTTGSSATPTAVPLSSTGTASSIAYRDANGNTKANNYARGTATTTTAAGTTTLTVGSAQFQQATGTTTQTYVLPDATTLMTGQSFIFSNQSTGALTINANGGGLIRTVPAGTSSTVTLITNGSAAGTWDPGTTATATGTVTAVSVASANGFTGSSSGGATPALTIATSITGLLKGNGTAISAATASTDYIAPASIVVRETPSGLVNGSNVTYGLANTPISGTESVYVNGILLEPGAGNDYTISGATITMLSALSGTGPDKIRVSYFK